MILLRFNVLDEILCCHWSLIREKTIIDILRLELYLLQKLLSWIFKFHISSFLWTIINVICEMIVIIFWNIMILLIYLLIFAQKLLSRTIEYHSSDKLKITSNTTMLLTFYSKTHCVKYKNENEFYYNREKMIIEINIRV